ncbi:MAG TPA: dephospho-CoA kinase [Actinomycetota bacterium]|nr:dephospho-CoA kinase [Actinomycetota bacterium]
MLLVGLTGGIGAGKSTVASMLAARGAVIIDADAIVRDLQKPGTDTFRRIVDRFGPAVVSDDGTLDRERVAAVVFRDDDARAALNAIVHPEVMRKIAERIDTLKDTDEVVVLDVPLLVEIGGGEGLDLIVVVEADEDLRVARLAASRSMSPDDARARMSTQASSAQRSALADVVVTNNGDEDALRGQVDALWERIRGGAA